MEITEIKKPINWDRRVRPFDFKASFEAIEYAICKSFEMDPKDFHNLKHCMQKENREAKAHFCQLACDHMHSVEDIAKHLKTQPKRIESRLISFWQQYDANTPKWRKKYWDASNILRHEGLDLEVTLAEEQLEIAKQKVVDKKAMRIMVKEKRNEKAIRPKQQAAFPFSASHIKFTHPWKA